MQHAQPRPLADADVHTVLGAAVCEVVTLRGGGEEELQQRRIYDKVSAAYHTSKRAAPVERAVFFAKVFSTQQAHPCTIRIVSNAPWSWRPRAAKMTSEWCRELEANAAASLKRAAQQTSHARVDQSAVAEWRIL